MHRTGLRLGAAALVIGLSGLALAPASAAAPVGEGTATAVRISVSGTPADSGKYTASNDGTKQTTSGSNRPAIGVLSGQTLLSEGTLAQDATTSVTNGVVRSAACAGLAGQGATVAGVGNASCLSGGKTLDLSAGALDLSKLQLTSGALADALPAQLTDALSSAQLSTLTSALSDGLKSGLTALGNPALSFDLGALQASCTAVPGKAEGTASLADAKLTVNIPSPGPGEITLLDLPADPAPNTPVSATPTVLLDAITAALRTGLDTSVANLPAPIATILSTLGAGLDQTAAIDAAIKSATDQLAPGLSQLLSGTLNKQSRPDADSIEVTALDLHVLPAAVAATGSSLVDLAVGQVTCDAGRVALVDPPKAATPSRVPTTIDSGLGDAPDGPSPVLTVLGVLMLLAGAGIGVRRVLRTRG